MEKEAPFLYNDYSSYLRRRLGCKVQKISLNAGFSCPNRDGRVGWGGCTYCNNQTFNPQYCRPAKSVAVQMQEGIDFFAHKYPQMRYLAYFQAYTNTYDALPALVARYEAALAVPGTVGIVIGTRPDCMPDALLDYLEELSRRTFVVVEYGIESCNDHTLLRINRGHTFADAVEAVERTAARGIAVGAHLIVGLPGDDDACLPQWAATLSRLPLTALKLHQLQLIRGTRMAQQFAERPCDFHLYTVEEYIDRVIDFIERLSPRIVLERFASQSPKELLIAPDWGLKNYEFAEKLKRQMLRRSTWQGKFYSQPAEPLL